MKTQGVKNWFGKSPYGIYTLSFVNKQILCFYSFLLFLMIYLIWQLIILFLPQILRHYLLKKIVCGWATDGHPYYLSNDHGYIVLIY